MSLKDLFLAEKSISSFLGWSSTESESGYSWFDAPLEIEGVTEVGFVLHGGCYPDKPDCNITFELCLQRLPGRKRIPLERFDWRALTGGHSNPIRRGRPWSGKTLFWTHLHAFDLNWSDEEERMFAGNLRMAREIDEDLQMFADVRAFVGKRFKINNIEVVTEPEWVYDLF